MFRKIEHQTIQADGTTRIQWSNLPRGGVTPNLLFTNRDGGMVRFIDDPTQASERFPEDAPAQRAQTYTIVSREARKHGILTGTDYQITLGRGCGVAEWFPARGTTPFGRYAGETEAETALREVLCGQHNGLRPVALRAFIERAFIPMGGTRLGFAEMLAREAAVAKLADAPDRLPPGLTTVHLTWLRKAKQHHPYLRVTMNGMRREGRMRMVHVIPKLGVEFSMLAHGVIPTIVEDDKKGLRPDYTWPVEGTFPALRAFMDELFFS